MVCEKCNERMNKGIRFCTNCGYNMKGAVPGKTLLRITGIIFLVFAVLGIANFLFFFRIQTMNIVGIFIQATSIILNTIIGILGIRYCKNNEKAKILRILGFVRITLSVVLFVRVLIIIGGFSQGYDFLLNDLFWRLPVIALSIFFVFGAQKNIMANGGK